MKKAFLILIVSLLALNISAQVSEGGLPPSYKNEGTKSNAGIASRTLRRIDTRDQSLQDAADGIPLMYAVLEEIAVDIKKEGTRTELGNSGTIWQYRINTPEGKSVQVIFSKYLIPEGAQLFLYNEWYSDIRGAFTNNNITEDLGFVTGDFRGDHVIIEYYEPAGVPFEGEVIIGQAGQAFIDILGPKSGNTDSDGFIGINCEEGIPLQDEKHAVCRFTFNDGKYSYLCSGALINTTLATLKPYFLTAAHCISTAETAATVVAYFNYEEAACTQNVLNQSRTLSGTSLLTTGSHSDYSLLMFDRLVPLSYNPYYAGWDAGGTALTSSSCIHHPGGRPKKVALDADPAETNSIDLSWEGGGMSPAGTHWAVSFEEGATSSGSSGAPLLDQNKRITGQLHGGSETDYFGKLSYSWDHPNSGYPTLQSLLDPGGTGVRSIDGFYPVTNIPDPQFATQISKVCTGTPVDLSGFSAFEPNDWQWSFMPSTVIYSDGTSSSSQSPKVSFMEERSYSVTLKVTNGAGQDELTLNDYISAGSELALRAFPEGLTDSCINSFTGLKLQAYGAYAYLWTLSEKADDLFYILNNTSNPVEIRLREGKSLTKSTNIEVNLSGIHGTCQEMLNLTIPLEAQTNDNAINAREISPGASGPFSNRCATTEDGEPIPPYSSCTGQLSWCNEYGTGQDIVERSVWFSYIPDANQTISISSSGFDNQLAIYSASSVSALLEGRYTLLAANDDFNDTDYNPVITSVDVKADQKYWIQVDGSAGGQTGTFYLNLSILHSIGENIAAGDEVKVYPQPADEFIFLESASFDRCSQVRIELTDTAGRIVLQENLTPEGSRIRLQPGNLAPGIYLTRIFCDGKVTTTRIIV